MIFVNIITVGVAIAESTGKQLGRLAKVIVVFPVLLKHMRRKLTGKTRKDKLKKRKEKIAQNTAEAEVSRQTYSENYWAHDPAETRNDITQELRNFYSSDAMKECMSMKDMASLVRRWHQS